MELFNQLVEQLHKYCYQRLYIKALDINKATNRHYNHNGVYPKQIPLKQI